MSRRHAKPALLVRVLTEIGKGRITEGFIHDKHEFVEGITDGHWITVNPAISVCDTLIHEVLHRLEPEWSENYVRRTTTFLLRRMSNEQVAQLYEEYKSLTKKRRRRGRSVPPPGSGLVPSATESSSASVSEVPGRTAGGGSD